MSLPCPVACGTWSMPGTTSLRSARDSLGVARGNTFGPGQRCHHKAQDRRCAVSFPALTECPGPGSGSGLMYMLLRADGLWGRALAMHREVAWNAPEHPVPARSIDPTWCHQSDTGAVLARLPPSPREAPGKPPQACLGGRPTALGLGWTWLLICICNNHHHKTILYSVATTCQACYPPVIAYSPSRPPCGIGMIGPRSGVPEPVASCRHTARQWPGWMWSPAAPKA